MHNGFYGMEGDGLVGDVRGYRKENTTTQPHRTKPSVVGGGIKIGGRDRSLWP